jgi:chromosome segregation ATPase
MKAEQDQVSRLKEELKEIRGRHEAEIKDIRLSVSNQIKHHEAETRKLGDQYTAAAKAAAAAEEKLNAHKADMVRWESRLHQINQLFASKSSYSFLFLLSYSLLLLPMPVHLAVLTLSPFC